MLQPSECSHTAAISVQGSDDKFCVTCNSFIEAIEGIEYPEKPLWIFDDEGEISASV